jgi:hypothetical protein
MSLHGIVAQIAGQTGLAFGDPVGPRFPAEHIHLFGPDGVAL